MYLCIFWGKTLRMLDFSVFCMDGLDKKKTRHLILNCGNKNSVV